VAEPAHCDRDRTCATAASASAQNGHRQARDLIAEAGAAAHGAATRPTFSATGVEVYQIGIQFPGRLSRVADQTAPRPNSINFVESYHFRPLWMGWVICGHRCMLDSATGVKPNESGVGLGT
jgi:hypothetical protein